MNKKNRTGLTVGILLACAALTAGFFVSQHIHQTQKKDLSQFAGTLLSTPRSVNPFDLAETNGNAFDNNRLKQHWTMVFFGFTQCGTICPTTMAELAKTYRLLEEESVSPLPSVVMVSIDPERDSLDKLKNYVKAFDVHFEGARGDEASIEKLTKELGIAYAKIAQDDYNSTGKDTFQHSGAIMLFNPQGELVAFFTPPHQAASIARDYQLLVG